MTTTHVPAHHDIAQRAQEIWGLRGNPSGHDLAIWLEAEQQLTEVSPELAHSTSTGSPQSSDPLSRKPTTTHSSGSTTPMPDPIEVAAKATLQKKTASAPHRPTHQDAPKSAPTESGKPLWSKPHSS